jgi:hypothetical protein
MPESWLVCPEMQLHSCSAEGAGFAAMSLQCTSTDVRQLMSLMRPLLFCTFVLLGADKGGRLGSIPNC